jgi:hypothetical protein
MSLKINRLPYVLSTMNKMIKNKNLLVRFAHFAAGIFKLQLFVPHHSRSKLPGIEHSWSNKKANSLSVTILTFFTLLIVILNLSYVAVHTQTQNEVFSFQSDVLDLKKKIILLDYYLEEVFDEASETIDGTTPTQDVKLLMFRVLGKYKLNTKGLEQEFLDLQLYVQSDAFFENVVHDEEKVGVRFEILLLEKSESSELSYLYSRSFEKVYK